MPLFHHHQRDVWRSLKRPTYLQFHYSIIKGTLGGVKNNQPTSIAFIPSSSKGRLKEFKTTNLSPMSLYHHHQTDNRRSFKQPTNFQCHYSIIIKGTFGGV